MAEKRDPEYDRIVARDARNALAAMQARAEKAERERDIARGVAEDRTEAALRAKEEYAAALEKVAERVKALEARLAEVGPVVEAAERQETAERVGAYLSDNEADRLEAGMAFDRATHETNNAVRVMRAARSLRGAGEGNAEARKGEEAGR